MTWSAEEPAKPRGKTVSTPPTSRSSTVIFRPSTVTSSLPFRQLVVNSEVAVAPWVSSLLAGLGPSERSRGKRRTMPMAAEPRANRPPSSLRRRTTMPPRSVTAAVMASRSSSVDWKSWRSSSKGPWGIRYLPQAVTPKPRASRPTPKVTACHWVLASSQ